MNFVNFDNTEIGCFRILECVDVTGNVIYSIDGFNINSDNEDDESYYNNYNVMDFTNIGWLRLVVVK